MHKSNNRNHKCSCDKSSNGLRLSYAAPVNLTIDRNLWYTGKRFSTQPPTTYKATTSYDGGIYILHCIRNGSPKSKICSAYCIFMNQGVAIPTHLIFHALEEFREHHRGGILGKLMICSVGDATTHVVFQFRHLNLAIRCTAHSPNLLVLSIAKSRDLKSHQPTAMTQAANLNKLRFGPR
jgi:hypothetical protein